MSNEGAAERKSIESHPSGLVGVREDIATVAADYVKCVIEPNLNLCTMMFFRVHYLPTMSGKAMVIDKMREEAFLEVKVPEKAVLALVMHLHQTFIEMEKNPKLREKTIFGPSLVSERKKENSAD